jgi:predicted RNA binding protein YcfA (HicA-like mRNA interferase family)
MGSPWPFVKARVMRRLLERELGYRAIRRSGSHVRMVSEGRPDITFAFHDDVSINPRTVRGILVRDVGLTLAEAEEVIKRV